MRTRGQGKKDRVGTKRSSVSGGTRQLVAEQRCSRAVGRSSISSAHDVLPVPSAMHSKEGLIKRVSTVCLDQRHCQRSKHSLSSARKSLSDIFVCFLGAEGCKAGRRNRCELGVRLIFFGGGGGGWFRVALRARVRERARSY